MEQGCTGYRERPEYISKNNNIKQGKTTESQVKGEIHEQMTNNKKCQSPEFPEIGNIRVQEFSRNGKHRKFRSFRKLNNKQIHIPRKLTGVPGCVRIV